MVTMDPTLASQFDAIDFIQFSSEEVDLTHQSGVDLNPFIPVGTTAFFEDGNYGPKQ